MVLFKNLDEDLMMSSMCLESIALDYCNYFCPLKAYEVPDLPEQREEDKPGGINFTEQKQEDIVLSRTKRFVYNATEFDFTSPTRAISNSFAHALLYVYMVLTIMVFLGDIYRRIDVNAARARILETCENRVLLASQVFRMLSICHDTFDESREGVDPTVAIMSVQNNEIILVDAVVLPMPTSVDQPPVAARNPEPPSSENSRFKTVKAKHHDNQGVT